MEFELVPVAGISGADFTALADAQAKGGGGGGDLGCEIAGVAVAIAPALAFIPVVGPFVAAVAAGGGGLYGAVACDGPFGGLSSLGEDVADYYSGLGG